MKADALQRLHHHLLAEQTVIDHQNARSGLSDRDVADCSPNALGTAGGDDVDQE